MNSGRQFIVWSTRREIRVLPLCYCFNCISGLHCAPSLLLLLHRLQRTAACGSIRPLPKMCAPKRGHLQAHQVGLTAAVAARQATRCQQPQYHVRTHQPIHTPRVIPCNDTGRSFKADLKSDLWEPGQALSLQAAVAELPVRLQHTCSCPRLSGAGSRARRVWNSPAHAGACYAR